MGKTLYQKYTNGCSVSKFLVGEDFVEFQFDFMGYKFKTIKIECEKDDKDIDADFSVIEFYRERIKSESVNTFYIDKVQGIGFLIVLNKTKIFVPTYDYSTGYYDGNAKLIITYKKYNEDGSVLTSKETTIDLGKEECIQRFY